MHNEYRAIGSSRQRGGRHAHHTSIEVARNIREGMTSPKDPILMADQTSEADGNGTEECSIEETNSAIDRIQQVATDDENNVQ